MSKEVSRIQEKATTTNSEVSYRESLNNYFAKSPGTDLEKLQNFTKYVPRQNIARLLSKYEIFKQIVGTQGSVIECGVYLGGGLMTFAHLSAILEQVNHQRRIIGFDTFEGFTPLSEVDKKGGSQHASEGGMAVHPCIAA